MVIAEWVGQNKEHIAAVVIATTCCAIGFWWFYSQFIKEELKSSRTFREFMRGELGVLTGNNLSERIGQLERDSQAHNTKIELLVSDKERLKEQHSEQERKIEKIDERLHEQASEIRLLQQSADAIKLRLQEAQDLADSRLTALKGELVQSIADGDKEAQISAAKSTVETLRMRLTLSRIPTGAPDPNIERELEQAEIVLARLRGDDYGRVLPVGRR